jgi:hypothetical protein
VGHVVSCPLGLTKYFPLLPAVAPAHVAFWKVPKDPRHGMASISATLRGNLASQIGIPLGQPAGPISMNYVLEPLTADVAVEEAVVEEVVAVAVVPAADMALNTAEAEAMVAGIIITEIIGMATTIMVAVDTPDVGSTMMAIMAITMVAMMVTIIVGGTPMKLTLQAGFSLIMLTVVAISKMSKIKINNKIRAKIKTIILDRGIMTVVARMEHSLDTYHSRLCGTQ